MEEREDVIWIDGGFGGEEEGYGKRYYGGGLITLLGKHGVRGI